MAERVPAQREAEDQDHVLKSGDEMQFIAEGLLASLVAEQMARLIGAGRSADQCPEKQRGLANAAAPSFCPALVETEGGKGDEVHRDQVIGEVLGGEDIWRHRDI